MVQNKEKENKLILIPKTEKYMEYMLQIMLKLPRTEKFSIGTEYKKSMYEMIENILIVSKIEGSEVIKILNQVDAKLSVQRIFFKNHEKRKMDR